MQPLQPQYSPEEFAQCGDELYRRTIEPLVQDNDAGKYVVIDIETGDYEMDHDEIIAADRLRVRRPHGQIWLARIGSRYARRFRTHHRWAATLCQT